MDWNWETINVADEIGKDPGWVYDILDGFREDGIPADEQRYMLAEAIYNRLKREEAELKRSGKLIHALVSNPGRVDCRSLADLYVSRNEDLHSDMDAIASRSRKRPAQSAARKPKATTKKAPAKKTTTAKKPANRASARRY